MNGKKKRKVFFFPFPFFLFHFFFFYSFFPFFFLSPYFWWWWCLSKKAHDTISHNISDVLIVHTAFCFLIFWYSLFWCFFSVSMKQSTLLYVVRIQPLQNTKPSSENLIVLFFPLNYFHCSVFVFVFFGFFGFSFLQVFLFLFSPLSRLSLCSPFTYMKWVATRS